MKIYIPSLNRPFRQLTWNELHGIKGADVSVVIGPQDEKNYANPGNNGMKLLVLPKSVKGIGNVRQWLLEYHAHHCEDDRMVMMDDDLTFFTRRDDDPTKARNSAASDKAAMLKALEGHLKHSIHGSILPREGANRVADEGVLYNTRLLRVLAYRAQAVLSAGVKFNRIPVMEDFDATLQLLRKGYRNFVLCEWWQNQAGSGLEGGCSTYRTMDVQAEGAHGLKKLHDPFVTIVQKTTKGAWGGGERTDVKIAWKKAFQSYKGS